jgi:hypothetical protein
MALATTRGGFPGEGGRGIAVGASVSGVSDGCTEPGCVRAAAARVFGGVPVREEESRLSEGAGEGFGVKVMQELTRGCQ